MESPGMLSNVPSPVRVRMRAREPRAAPATQFDHPNLQQLHNYQPHFPESSPSFHYTSAPSACEPDRGPYLQYYRSTSATISSSGAMDTMDPFSPDAPLSSNGSVSSPNQSADGHNNPRSTSPINDPSISATSNDDGRAGAPPTVPAACLACRGKHLKCDGQTPCSRCTASASECVYVASRRGYKGPRKNPHPVSVPHNPNKRAASSSPPSSSIADSCPMLNGTPVPTPTTSIASFNPAVVLPEAHPNPGFAPPSGLSTLQLFRNSFASGGQNGGDLTLAAATSGRTQTPQHSIAERCFDAYFHHYHSAHPFVLPKPFFLRLLKDTPTGIEHLVAAIRYVGSLFIDAGPTRALYLDEAIRLMYRPGVARDGFLVQAFLLVIVALDGSCEQERARTLLADVERLAVEIGINTRQFATMHGRGNPVLEESWRRTWWDLWVADGMIAGVHRVTNFLLFDIATDVALPCEEHQYLSGNIPQPMYMEDFDDQLFSGEDREFSSFAYRVAAARNLGRMMRMPPIVFAEDENIDRVETMLTNWRMHLPPAKRDALNKNCQLDEMMFQAHMITHACSIMLHQPHSQLDSSSTRTITSCAPHRMVPSGDVFNAHTRHTITSACAISKMVTQAVPMLSHTHFFMCVVTLSSIVHLSKWALYYINDEDDLRQQIRLNIGALNKLSEVWKAACTASGQVKGVAQDIYRAKKASQINPAFWVGFTQEQMMSSISADESIMSEINTMLNQPTPGHPPPGHQPL